jgi:hypothetical protein
LTQEYDLVVVAFPGPSDCSTTDTEIIYPETGDLASSG